MFALFKLDFTKGELIYKVQCDAEWIPNFLWGLKKKKSKYLLKYVLTLVKIVLLIIPNGKGNFFHLEFKTVNHRTTLDSHIPDIKPRVKNSAAQNRVCNPI